MVERCSEKESAQRKLPYVDTRRAVIPREKVARSLLRRRISPWW